MKYSELAINDIFKYNGIVFLKIPWSQFRERNCNAELLWEDGKKNWTLLEKFRYCFPADEEVNKIGNFSRMIEEWYLNK